MFVALTTSEISLKPACGHGRRRVVVVASIVVGRFLANTDTHRHGLGHTDTDVNNHSNISHSRPVTHSSDHPNQLHHVLCQ